MFFLGNIKSKRWIVWTIITIKHMLRDLPHQHVCKWQKTIKYNTKKPQKKKEKTNVDN